MVYTTVATTPDENNAPPGSHVPERDIPDDLPAATVITPEGTGYDFGAGGSLGSPVPNVRGLEVPRVVQRGKRGSSLAKRGTADRGGDGHAAARRDAAQAAEDRRTSGQRPVRAAGSSHVLPRLAVKKGHNWATEAHLALHKPGACDKSGEHPISIIKLNQVLLARFMQLCEDLIANGLVTKDIVLSQGVRRPEIAHGWSTASAIVKNLAGFKLPKGNRGGEKIKVAAGKAPGPAILLWNNLVELNGKEPGVDLDGNRWSRDEHGNMWPLEEIIRNANQIVTKAGLKGPAAEGYPFACPRRLPNIGKHLSNHLWGKAIDATIPWKDGWGNIGHEDTEKLIEKCELWRPIRGRQSTPGGVRKGAERWHFERPPFDFAGDADYDFDLTIDELIY